ncbi:MAG: MFS transporter [Verrucomicrobiota bacterium]
MSAALENPARSEPQKWPIFVVFCVIWSGLMLTEVLSINLLPITIKEFTDRASIISLILFINPAFGFIAQPLVGILSDRIWTPVGRRAFFLITCAPIVGTCLWFIPEARFLWHLVVLVIIYQFFQDVLWGSDHPLMADLFPPKQRMLVAGLIMASGQAAGAVFLKVGMPTFEGDLDMLYRIVGISQVVLVTGFAFFLNERPLPPSQRPKLTTKKYVSDLLGHPIRRKFAMLHFTNAVFQNIAIGSGFLVIFVTINLGATEGEYGENWWYSNLIPLLFSIPSAILIEKFASKRWVLVAGFVIAISGLAIGWLADEVTDIMSVAFAYGFGMMLITITFKPFFTEYVPKEIIGQVSGALNICYALGRSAAILVAGFVIEYVFDNDYRYIFPMSIAAGMVGLVIALSIRDHRYESRIQTGPAKPKETP